MQEQFQRITFIERWIHGELSDEERNRFERWLDENPEERARVEQIKKIYRGIGQLEPGVIVDSRRVWHNIRQSVQHSSGTFPHAFLRVAAAAAVILVAVLFTYVWWPAKTITITAERAQHITHFLPDSSKVILNAESSISYTPGTWNESRDISLTGEAFFNVRKGSTFRVSATRGVTEVLGTRFNVNTRGKSDLVTCVEGKVSVYPKQEVQPYLILEAGEAAAVANDRVNRVETPVISWISGRFTFRSVPLRKVFEEMGRQFDISIRYPSELGDKKFTGEFYGDDLNKALETVSTVSGTRYSVQNNRQTITFN